jgi:hypothetical protein
MSRKEVVTDEAKYAACAAVTKNGALSEKSDN